MGFKQRTIRDGTGSHKDSFRRTIEGKSIGRRKESGEICPYEDESEKLKGNAIFKQIGRASCRERV